MLFELTKYQKIKSKEIRCFMCKEHDSDLCTLVSSHQNAIFDICDMAFLIKVIDPRKAIEFFIDINSDSIDAFICESDILFNIITRTENLLELIDIFWNSVRSLNDVDIDEYENPVVLYPKQIIIKSI